MRILIINNDAPPLGGAEHHVKLLHRLLESKGHQVTCFYPYSHYGSSSVSEVKKAFLNLIEGKIFDIAHIHNLEYKFSLLLDILYEKNVKMIQTLHDFRYICASGSFFRKGKICSECMEGRYYKAALNGCFSFLHSFGRYFNETVFKMDPVRIKKIACYISPSLSLINVLKEGGFDGEIIHIYNFLDLDTYKTDVEPIKENPYIVYFGRLTEDKGLMTLLSAIKGTGIKLYIIGKGFLEKKLMERIETEKGLENVELKGFMQGQKLFDLIGGSRFTVVPSEWWENLPYAILESFALGKTCIASDLGGISELVNSERGLLFKAGDYLDLREKIVNLYHDLNLISVLGNNGRNFVRENMSDEIYYDRIIELYSGL